MKVIQGQKKFEPEETLRQQNFESKEIFNPKKFGSRKFWVKTIVGLQNFGSKEIKACKKLGPKSLVKIGSVTAEIFLIWTNVARRNVAWTNVTVIQKCNTVNKGLNTKRK